MVGVLAAGFALALFILAFLAYLVGGAEDRLAFGAVLAGLVALSLAMVEHVAAPPPGGPGPQA